MEFNSCRWVWREKDQLSVFGIDQSLVRSEPFRPFLIEINAPLYISIAWS